MAVIKDNFLNRLNNCRNEINTKFKQITDNLITRQNQLLTELDNIEKNYTESQKSETEIEQIEKVKREQNKVLEGALNILQENVVTSMKDTIKNLDNQIYNFRQKREKFTSIDLKLDTFNINTLIGQLGSVIKLTQDCNYIGDNNEKSNLTQFFNAPNRLDNTNTNRHNTNLNRFASRSISGDEYSMERISNNQNNQDIIASPISKNNNNLDIIASPISKNENNRDNIASPISKNENDRDIIARLRCKNNNNLDIIASPISKNENKLIAKNENDLIARPIARNTNKSVKQVSSRLSNLIVMLENNSELIQKVPNK